MSGQITITIDFADLQELIKDRDRLRDRIAELEATPLDFSLEKLSRDVLDRGSKNGGYGLTPDQEKEISDCIKRGGRSK